MSDSIETTTNLLGFFHDELALALKETGIQTSQETEAYLVHLLEGFALPTPDRAKEIGFDVPAAHLLEQAMQSDGDKRIEIYRRLGDASLYTCGFFEARLTRRSLSAEYYRNVGRTAYSSLTDMMTFKQPGGVFEVIFRELAAKFDKLVAAFRLVSGQSLGAKELLRADDLESHGLLWVTKAPGVA